jgi:hypothetical protein
VIAVDSDPEGYGRENLKSQPILITKGDDEMTPRQIHLIIQAAHDVMLADGHKAAFNFLVAELEGRGERVRVVNEQSDWTYGNAERFKG